MEREIAIIDYKVGNVRSVEKALVHVADELRRRGGPAITVALTADREVIRRAAGVVLPGVGAFGECVTNLRTVNGEALVGEAIDAGKPLLGICVGMQLLFEASEEMGEWPGLGLLPGRVRRFGSDLRVPQIGWNQLRHDEKDPLLTGAPDGSYAYFVHSYYCDAEDVADVVATTEYGIEYPAIVRRGLVWGIQCHPEKSHAVGLRILQNFLTIVVSELQAV